MPNDALPSDARPAATPARGLPPHPPPGREAASAAAAPSKLAGTRRRGWSERNGEEELGQPAGGALPYALANSARATPRRGPACGTHAAVRNQPLLWASPAAGHCWPGDRSLADAARRPLRRLGKRHIGPGSRWCGPHPACCWTYVQRRQDRLAAARAAEAAAAARPGPLLWHPSNKLAALAPHRRPGACPNRPPATPAATLLMDLRSGDQFGNPETPVDRLRRAGLLAAAAPCHADSAPSLAELPLRRVPIRRPLLGDQQAATLGQNCAAGRGEAKCNLTATGASGDLKHPAAASCAATGACWESTYGCAGATAPATYLPDVLQCRHRHRKWACVDGLGLIEEFREIDGLLARNSSRRSGLMLVPGLHRLGTAPLGSPRPAACLNRITRDTGGGAIARGHPPRASRLAVATLVELAHRHLCQALGSSAEGAWPTDGRRRPCRRWLLQAPRPDSCGLEVRRRGRSREHSPGRRRPRCRFVPALRPGADHPRPTPAPSRLLNQSLSEGRTPAVGGEARLAGGGASQVWGLDCEP